ncbi:MAG: glycosyltransferase family 4 protein [Candidatus Hermodarchaeota archaeon]
MNIEDVSLTLFFTGGVSLKNWVEVGNLDRELELYKRLNETLKEINIVSYGGNKDFQYSKKLEKINLLPTSWYKHSRLTILSLQLKNYSQLIARSDILKTNQISGFEIPLWFKKKYNQKLIVRCGYLYSYFMKKKVKNKQKVEKVLQLEKKAFESSDLGFVSSPWQQELIIKQYSIEPADKIKVIPNYVITDVFKPLPNIQKKFDLIFIGRGDKQKNIPNLLKALHYLKTKEQSVSLLMVGGCCFNTKIKEIIDQYHLDVILKGYIPNFRLPEVINQAKIFILPSYYEGHPKVLLEAMSCGVPCIGTNVTGIKHEIKHLNTGFLSKTDFRSIAESIDILLADKALRTKLGKNAREYISKNYSLDKILPLELKAIEEVISS